MNLLTHTADKCTGQHCCIHNPSHHHMSKWPMIWRDDKEVMERICPHGIGHPDPDDVAHGKRIGRDDALNIHGCDGCCKGGVHYEDTEPSIPDDPRDLEGDYWRDEMRDRRMEDKMEGLP